LHALPLYQYIYAEADVLTLTKILGMLGLNLDPFPLESFVALSSVVFSGSDFIMHQIGRSLMSWSGGEDRVLPNGVEIPVGFRIKGQYLMFMMFNVDLEIILPITPTMVIALAGSLLSAGSLAAFAIKLMISEMLNGYSVLIKGEMPPWNFLFGVIRLWRSESDSSKGPMIDFLISVKPLSFPPIQWRWRMGAYLNVMFGVLEYEVMIEILAVGIRVSGMRSIWGIKQGMLLEILPAVMGFFSNPGGLIENSVIRAGVLFDLQGFNRLVLDPLNFLVDLFLDGVSYLIGLIPVIGSKIVDIINTLRKILRMRFYRIFAAFILKPWSAGLIFQISAYAFGFDLDINVQLQKTPVEIIKHLWSDVFLPIYEEIAVFRGPPIPLGCPAGQEEMFPMCAPACRSGYSSRLDAVVVKAFPTCWQVCPSGYEEVGITCVRIRRKGFNTCGKYIRYPCGCDSGYVPTPIGCVSIHIFTRDFYVRLPLPVHSCGNRGSWSSKEYWLILPTCYKSCSPRHFGVHADCIDKRFVPGQ
jgi:hypothetical protein